MYICLWEVEGGKSREAEGMDEGASVEARWSVMWCPGNVETIGMFLREAVNAPDEN